MVVSVCPLMMNATRVFGRSFHAAVFNRPERPLPLNWGVLTNKYRRTPPVRDSSTAPFSFLTVRAVIHREPYPKAIPGRRGSTASLSIGQTFGREGI